MPACIEKQMAQKHPVAQLLPLIFLSWAGRNASTAISSNTDSACTPRMWPTPDAAGAYLLRPYLTSAAAAAALEAHQ